ncbi:MAG TPA: response regulator [Bacillales bacterium]|nr:response regulator [Bacillales bacterium]
MEQIKGMLVDDEVNILRNLRTIVPWEDLGIDIVGMAKNGKEALEIFHEYQPDLILCDIRMPVMDGIELIKQVNEENEKCEIVMLTGYKDFEYMQSSIRYGVLDYILKPIDYDELREVAERAASDIRVRQLKEVMEKKKWGKIAHLAYEKSLHDSLMGYVSSSPWIWENREGDNETLVYLLLVVDIDHYSQKARFWTDEDRRMWHFAVKNVLSEALQDYGLSYTVLQMREGEYCVIIERTQKEHSSIQEWANKLRTVVNQHLKLDVSVGVFESYVQIEQLAKAYKIVQRDLHLTPDKHENQLVLTYDEVRQGKEIDYFLWDKVERIVSELKNGDRDKSTQALMNLKKDLQLVSEESLVHIEQILHYLSLHLLREMKDLGVIDDNKEEAVWKKLKRTSGNKDLMNVIEQLVNDSMDAFFKKKKSETLMIAAEDYMNRNLGDDFGVNEIANYLGISPSYFSMLFKQYFNETFVEYLTRQRMERAKTLMVTTNLSIAKMSRQLGYSDRRYFTKVFHKYTGKNPSEYRETYC